MTNKMLALVLLFSSMLFSQNYVTNPEFDQGLVGWWFPTNSPGVAAASLDDSGMLSGDNSALIEITNGGTANWHILAMSNIFLQQDITYDISFKALADEQVNITMNISKSVSPWSDLWSKTVKIGGDTDTFGPFTYTQSVEDEKNDIKFYLGGTAATQIWLDSIVVIESEETMVKNMDSFLHGYQLEQNYPNPFNPTTTINYTLAKESTTKLQVTNLAGQLIKTLVDEYQQQGTHSVMWDGRDNQNLQVASGIYLYKLYADNTLIMSRKMTVLQ